MEEIASLKKCRRLQLREPFSAERQERKRGEKKKRCGGGLWGEKEPGFSAIEMEKREKKR